MSAEEEDIRDPMLRALKGLVKIMETREAQDYMGKISTDRGQPSTGLKISEAKSLSNSRSASSDDPPDAIRSILSEVCAAKESANV